MMLHDWVLLKDLSYAKAAEYLDLPNAMAVWRYCHGGSIPKPAAMQLILERTRPAR
jgi:hypothetical protein